MENAHYVQELISEYEAGNCEAFFVALYMARKAVAADEFSLLELPSWLSSEIRRIVRLSDQGAPIQSVGSNGLDDHSEIVKKFSVILKRNGIYI